MSRDKFTLLSKQPADFHKEIQIIARGLLASPELLAFCCVVFIARCGLVATVSGLSKQPVLVALQTNFVIHFVC